MRVSTIIGFVLVGLILIGIAGSAIGTAAKDCANQMNERNRAMQEELNQW